MRRRSYRERSSSGISPARCLPSTIVLG
jgi:hypothetical protein